jgi:hypothetical protein
LLSFSSTNDPVNDYSVKIDAFGKLFVYHKYNIFQPTFPAGFYDVEGEIFGIKNFAIATDSTLAGIAIFQQVAEAQITNTQILVINVQQQVDILVADVNTMSLLLNTEMYTLGTATSIPNLVYEFENVAQTISINYANNLAIATATTVGIGGAVPLILASTADYMNREYYKNMVKNYSNANFEITDEDRRVLYSLNDDAYYSNTYNYNYYTCNLTKEQGFINSNIITPQTIPNIYGSKIGLNTIATTYDLDVVGKINADYYYKSGVNINDIFVNSNDFKNAIYNYSVERKYPSRAPDIKSGQSTTSFLGKTVNTSTYTINSNSTLYYDYGIYTLYFSSYFSSTTNQVYNIFDSDLGNRSLWAQNYNYQSGLYTGTNYIVNDWLGDWIILKLTKAIILTKIIFNGSVVYADLCPGLWKIYASNDGVIWDYLPDVSNTTTRITRANYLATGGVYTKTIANSDKPYLYYGLVVKQISGNGNYLDFAEWQIYGIEKTEKYLTYNSSMQQDFINSNVLTPQTIPNIYGSKIGLNTVATTYDLDVVGKINADYYYKSGVPFTGSQWINNSTSIYYNDGNIGIGLNSPFSKLDIYETIYTKPLLILDAGAWNAPLPKQIGYPLLRLGKNSYSTTNHNYYGIGFGYCGQYDEKSPAEIGYMVMDNNQSEKGDLLFSTRDTVIPNDAAIERMRITALGNVGIGKTNPNASYLLDVNGIINATDIYKNGAVFSGSRWGLNGTTIYYTTGNVGIGTNSVGSQYKLELAGDLKCDKSFQNFFYTTATTYGNPIKTLFSGDGDRVILKAGNSTTYGHVIGIDSSFNLWQNIPTTKEFKFYIDNVEKFKINETIISTTNNFGIGTTDPKALLHVNGRLSSGNLITAANSVRAINLVSTDAVMRIWRNDGANAPAIELIQGDTSTANSYSHYWDIGVEPTNGSMYFRNRYPSANIKALTILNNGNIGINKANPSTNLEVGGNIYLDGYIQSPFVTCTDTIYGNIINCSSLTGNPPEVVKRYKFNLTLYYHHQDAYFYYYYANIDLTNVPYSYGDSTTNIRIFEVMIVGVRAGIDTSETTYSSKVFMKSSPFDAYDVYTQNDNCSLNLINFNTIQIITTNPQNLYAYVMVLDR